MKENEDKHLEELIDRIMKDQTLESPSFDFTSKIMSQIEVTKTSNVTVYKPLISKSILIGIIGSIIVLVLYSILFGNQQSTSTSSLFDFSVLYKNALINSFHLSKTATYSILLTTIFLFVQISFLKSYFDKKFDI